MQNLWIKNNIVNIALVISLLLPQTNIGFFTQMALLVVLLFFKDWKIKNIYTILVSITIIISFILNINEFYSIKNSFRVVFLLFLFTTFPICKYQKISNNIIIISLIFILFSQLSIAYRIPGIITLFDSLYPAGDIFNSEYAKELTSINDLSNSRYAGIYRNPNVCAEYVSFLCLIFIIENLNKPITKTFSFLTLFMVSILLTGGRTGIIVFIIGVLFYLFSIYKKNKLKLIIWISLFSIGILFLIEMADFRIFNLESGFKEDGSLYIKLKIFTDYINNPDLSFLKFLFGHFSIDNSLKYNVGMFDSGVGYYFFSFGLIGIFILLLFYLSLFKLKDKNIYIIFAINLFAISSSVLMAYRMSFLFILILSNYYSLNYQRNKNDTIIGTYF